MYLELFVIFLNQVVLVMLGLWSLRSSDRGVGNFGRSLEDCCTKHQLALDIKKFPWERTFLDQDEILGEPVCERLRCLACGAGRP